MNFKTYSCGTMVCRASPLNIPKTNQREGERMRVVKRES